MTVKQFKIFVLLFFTSFIAINWNDVSWIFNYRVTSSLFYDFFNPYQVSGAVANKNGINGREELFSAANLIERNGQYVQKNNFIEIPKIGISAPLIIGGGVDEKIMAENLNNGTVLYAGSSLPGENGQTVILGHSAPAGWPKIKYDWVFSEINNLDIDDKIVLNFNNKRHIYRVIGQKIIEKGQEIEVSDLSENNNTLVLISCWPPGKNYKRIAVRAELIN